MELHEKRRCKCTEHTGDEDWHGRPSGHAWHRCRCLDCRQAQLAAGRVREARRVRPRREAPRKEWSQAYHLANRASHRAAGRRKRQRDGAVSQVATRRWAPWSSAERATALRDDLSARDVASLLGRTVDSVNRIREEATYRENARRHKRRIAEVNAKALRRGPWTPDEISVALRADLTALEAASLLGRTYHSVTRQRDRLRKAAANA